MRILDFADGFESAVQPTIVGVTASSVTNVPSGNLAATNVQTALNELQADIDTRSTSASVTSLLAAHEADTTAIHGITDTAALVTLAGVQTLTNKTLTSPSLTTPSTDIVTLDGQAATPANPAAGFYKAYVKDSTGKLAILNSAGTETEVGSGSGSGGINLITNSDAETDTTGWATYKDAVAVAPVDGTGGTPTLTFTRTTTTNRILTGTGSFLFDSPIATNTQGEGASFNFTVPRQYSEAATRLFISFDYENLFFADADMFRVYLYDVTAATLITIHDLNNLNGVLTSSIDPARFVGHFETKAGNTSYRLIIHCSSARTDNYQFTLDNVKVSPDATVPGAILTPWTAYTPTGSWVANSTYTGFWRRVGDTMEVQAKVALSGAPTAAVLTFNLPSGYTIDTAKLVDPVVNQQALGMGYILDAGVLSYDAVVLYNNTTSVEVRAKNSAATYVDNRQVNATVPITFGASDLVDVTFKIPISGWLASAALSTTETMLSTVKVNYSTNAAQSIPNNTATIVDFEDKDYDDTTAVTTGAAWKFTAPKTAKYAVKAMIGFADSAAWTVGESAWLMVYKNGVVYRYLDFRELGATNTEPVFSGGSTDISLTKGDYIDIRVQQNSGLSIALDGAATSSWVSITEIPDFSIFSVYGVTEYQESANSTLTNWAFAASAYGDFASLTLPPGEYDLTGVVEIYNNGAVTTGTLVGAISTTAGNSGAGIANAINRASTYNSGANTMADSVAVSNYRVVVSTTTTYYLKGNYGSTITNLQAAYRFSARRVK